MPITRGSLGFRHRRIHRGAQGQSPDVVEPGETAVHQQLRRAVRIALFDLADHQHHLPLVAAAVGDVHAHDHLAGRVAGQLRVVRRTKAAAG